MPTAFTRWTACLALLTATLFASGAHAAWPDKSVRLILPLAPGGAMDVLGRSLADALGARWNVPVVVENRAGAGGNIGAEQVARAEPDGYTLLLTGDMLVANETLFKGNINYDATRSFAPISIVATAPTVIVVRSASPLQSLQDLRTLATERVVNIGTPGFGNSNHIALTRLQARIDGTLQHIPYKGAGPAVIGVLGGETDAAIVALPAVTSQIESGALRALAVVQDTRSAVVPNTPTVKQAGLDVDAGTGWFGLLAPAGTPDPIIADIQQAVSTVVSAGALHGKLAGLGFEPVGSPSATFVERIARDVQTFPPLLKAANVAVN
ncbi:tripartite tricarboxylate transporter substrate binding protein [Alcaligenaceae bacterium C4P045]|nr:tripartite tricarboxylate transporter substrate binding protein [Alcaligenaceae bacterium C4P045]